MLFYGAVIAMLCGTLMITHCTYQEAQCKSEAIKANMAIEKINALCVRR